MIPTFCYFMELKKGIFATEGAWVGLTVSVPKRIYKASAYCRLIISTDPLQAILATLPQNIGRTMLPLLMHLEFIYSTY